FHARAKGPTSHADARSATYLPALREGWGIEEWCDQLFREVWPSLAANEEDRQWFANSVRLGASPEVAYALNRAFHETDLRDLLARHHALVRRELARFRGHERDTAGDGFFATFDGPARAIRAAQAIVDGVRTLGLEARIGIHVGECELHDGKIAGLAVNIGSRVASNAGAGEVLVSQTVRDLVAGSGIRFEDRGVHDLKGIPGSWQLFAVVAADT